MESKRREEIGGRMRTIVTCCGDDIICDQFTNTCDHCGADYNSAGWELVPRSQWGEETGESVADILSVDCHDPFDED